MALVESESSADKYEVLEIIGTILSPSLPNTPLMYGKGRGAFATARKVRRRNDQMVRFLKFLPVQSVAYTC